MFSSRYRYGQETDRKFAPFNQLVNTPNRTSAAAFSRYLNGEILADSRSLQWSDLYVRHCRFPRVVDRFLVPATAEPHISCTIVGSAEFLERDPGGRWLTHHIRRGDIFVTRSRTPYEVRFRSPAGEELETIAIHVGIDSFRTALEAIYPGNASACLTLFGAEASPSRGKER